MDAAPTLPDCNETPTAAFSCSALLAVHAEKWSEVCKEIEAKDPNNPAMLWVNGYVFGLRHAADMESRSQNGADSAKPQCTPHLSGEKSDAANSEYTNPGSHNALNEQDGHCTGTKS